MLQEDRYSLLIVDPDPRWSKRFGFVVERLGFRVGYADSIGDAAGTLEAAGADFVLVGLADPNWVDTNELKRLTELGPQTWFIALTTDQNESFEELLRQLEFRDFLSRSMPLHQLAQIVSRYGEMRRLDEQNFRFGQLLECRTSYESLIGGSAPMRALYRLIDQVSRTDAPVMVSGEIGSEYADVARSIHQRSERGMHPFVMVDGADGDTEQIEAAVLGPVGGSSYPTGPSATGSAFARAGKGTLVLGSIERFGESTQSRLLDFLRVPFFQGETSTSAQPVSRLVVWTSDNLQKAVQEGRFNRELYYRLSILHVRVPPLRDRREDIPMLAEHLLQARAEPSRRRKKQPTPTFTSDALFQLFQYDWPENLDELKRAVADAAKGATGLRIGTEHLPKCIVEGGGQKESPTIGSDLADIPLREAKRHFESAYFKGLLTHTGGNMTLASRISKVGRPYLYKKLKDYEIDPDEFRQTG